MSDIVDGWARLDDARALDRAVKIARTAILDVLAGMPQSERDAFWARMRAMTGEERDALIAEVLRIEGVPEDAIETAERVAVEKAHDGG